MRIEQYMNMTQRENTFSGVTVMKMKAIRTAGSWLLVTLPRVATALALFFG